MALKQTVAGAKNLHRILCRQVKSGAQNRNISIAPEGRSN